MALPPPPPRPDADPPLQYTHSGVRYLLGYTATSFGIWDRERPAAPAETFPRTDAGWRAAWLRYSALQPNNVEVGLATGGGSSGPPDPGRPSWGSSLPAGARAASGRRVSGWWWLLPILMGWLGGLIAWLVVRADEPHKARQMLLLGVAISVGGFLLIVLASASVDPT